VLAILLCHELGHYLAARRYDIDVSPPYFIPVPLFPTFIGTMGAFIRLRSVLNDRRQLFDIGVWGPIAGFVVALPVLVLGVAVSQRSGHGRLPGCCSRWEPRLDLGRLSDHLVARHVSMTARRR